MTPEQQLRFEIVRLLFVGDRPVSPVSDVLDDASLVEKWIRGGVQEPPGNTGDSEPEVEGI